MKSTQFHHLQKKTRHRFMFFSSTNPTTIIHESNLNYNESHQTVDEEKNMNRYSTCWKLFFIELSISIAWVNCLCYWINKTHFSNMIQVKNILEKSKKVAWETAPLTAITEALTQQIHLKSFELDQQRVFFLYACWWVWLLCIESL